MTIREKYGKCIANSDKYDKYIVNSSLIFLSLSFLQNSRTHTLSLSFSLSLSLYFFFITRLTFAIMRG